FDVDDRDLHSFPTRRSSDLIMLLQIDELVIVDNLAGRTYLIVYADPQQPEAYALARRRLKALREKLRTPVVIPYAYASMQTPTEDRKSTRLNSSHVKISYAV